MKKSIYLAAFAALALASCSNDSDSVFDKSAADRLEDYKKEYREVLTADGGLWTMEYFSNSEEPGYLFVMRFNSDGSVNIAANHKWIGNAYREETSLWQMIADNGPVISFNSYNNIFHIFSDPANITGPDAPKGDSDNDIDETGYGHDGDYEFQVMEVSDEGKTIRLLGKKRLLHIYMHRLPADTDVKAYMEEYKKIEQGLFCKEIPALTLKGFDGEDYNVSGCHTGIMSISPAAGDAVEQTRKANFIITPTGIRFMNPFEIVDAAGNEKIINGFTFTDGYSLASDDCAGAILNAGSYAHILTDNQRNWKIDLKSFDGELKSQLNSFIKELKELYGYNSATISEAFFDYDSSNSRYILRLKIRIASNAYETNRFAVSFNDVDNGIKLNIGEACDNSSELALKSYKELQKLLNMLTGEILKCDCFSLCGPKNITLSNSNGSVIITAS